MSGKIAGSKLWPWAIGIVSMIWMVIDMQPELIAEPDPYADLGVVSIALVGCWLLYYLIKHLSRLFVAIKNSREA